MKEKIAEILSLKLRTQKERLLNLIEVPKDPKLGDFSFPCFSLAKEKRKNPAEIAKELSIKLRENKEFEKIEVAGGYLNFFINRNSLAEDTINLIQKQKDKFGSSKIGKEKTMVEFSQANTHKAFHIGHVRGTSLGESIARICEFVGDKVTRANYQGDTGMHVAKWIWCYTKHHFKENLRQDEAWIAGIYVDAVKRLLENELLQSEVEEINRKLELKEDEKLNELWKKTRKISLDSFEKIYKELNTKFDNYFFESELEKRGKEITKELVSRKIAEPSEGAIIINLERYNLGVWVLLRKDGTVLYSAKDLALAEEKFKKFKIDRSIYVVGSAQKLHFEQLFKTLELMKFKQAEKCKYVPVTEVRLPHGKMSSRTGDNVLYSEFIKELVRYAKEEIGKRHKLSEGETEARALAIAIAALKYSMLKQDTNKPIIFTKEEALSFEGNTGPYLLYTYARARSIIKKADYSQKIKLNITALNDLEKNLISKLASFPQIVKHSYENLSPNIIANYAYQISQIFNEFYHSNQVIKSENEQFRLVLVDSFSQVLKNALNLLGIPVIEQM